MGVPRFKRTGRDAVSGQLRVECRLGDDCLAVGSGADYKAARMAARLQVLARNFVPPPPIPSPPIPSPSPSLSPFPSPSPFPPQPPLTLIGKGRV